MDRDHNEAERTKRIGPTQGDPANPSDKRKFNVDIAADIARQVVVIKFGEPVRSIELTPEEANGMSAALRRKVLELGIAACPGQVTAREG